MFHKENCIQQVQQCRFFFVFLINSLINLIFRNNETFHVIFASGITRDYLVTPSMIGAQTGIICEERDWRGKIFSDANPLYVTEEDCGISKVCIWYVSPIWELSDTKNTISYGLMGEFHKLTGVNRQRITSIIRDAKDGPITITCKGVFDEPVRLIFSYPDGEWALVSCWTSETSDVVRFILHTYISCG